MLRTTKGDEGSDCKCPVCGDHLVVGRCLTCGVFRECDGCDDPADRLYIDEVEEDGKTFKSQVFLCRKCADYAFEIIADDANTP